MKKGILLLTVVLLNAIHLNAEIIITKSNRGLFGYKHIVEQQAEGQHRLDCSDPGRMSCKSSLGTIVVSSENGDLQPFELTETQFDAIDLYVENQLLSLNESGNFVYDNLCFVKFYYDPTNDFLEIRIYSIQEAQLLNLI